MNSKPGKHNNYHHLHQHHPKGNQSVNNNNSNKYSKSQRKFELIDFTADKRRPQNVNNQLVNGTSATLSSNRSLKVSSASTSTSLLLKGHSKASSAVGQHHSTKQSNHEKASSSKGSNNSNISKMSAGSTKQSNKSKDSGAPSSWRAPVSNKIKKAKEKDRSRKRDRERSLLASPSPPTSSLSNSQLKLSFSSSLKSSKSSISATTLSIASKQSPSKKPSVLRSSAASSSEQHQSNHEATSPSQHPHRHSSSTQSSHHRSTSSHSRHASSTSRSSLSTTTSTSSSTRVSNSNANCLASPSKPQKSSKQQQQQRSSSNKVWPSVSSNTVRSSPQKKGEPPPRASPSKASSSKPSQCTRGATLPNGITESHRSPVNSLLLSATHCATNEEYRQECADFITAHNCEELACPRERYDDFDKLQNILEQRCVQLERRRLWLRAEKKAYAKMLKNIPEKKKDRTKKDSAAYFLEHYKNTSDYPGYLASAQANASTSSSSNVALNAASTSSSSLISKHHAKHMKRRRANSSSNSESERGKGKGKLSICAAKSDGAGVGTTDNIKTRSSLMISAMSTAVMLGSTSGSLISEKTRRKTDRNKTLLKTADKHNEMHLRFGNVGLFPYSAQYEQFIAHCRRLFAGDMTREVHLEPLQAYLKQDSFMDTVRQMVEMKQYPHRGGTNSRASERNGALKKEEILEEQTVKRNTRSLSRNHSIDQTENLLSNGPSPCKKRRKESDYLLASTIGSSKSSFLNGYKVPRINGALRSTTSISPSPSTRSGETEPPQNNRPPFNRSRSRSPSSNLNKMHLSRKLYDDIMNDHFGTMTRRTARALETLVEPTATSTSEAVEKKDIKRQDSSTLLSPVTKKAHDPSHQVKKEPEQNLFVGAPSRKYQTADCKLKESIRCTAEMLSLMNTRLSLFAPDCDPGCAHDQLAECLSRNPPIQEPNQSSNLQGADHLIRADGSKSAAVIAGGIVGSSSALLPPPSTPVPKRRGRKSRSDSTTTNGTCPPTPCPTPNSPRVSLASSFSFNMPTTRGRKRSFAESMDLHSDSSMQDEFDYLHKNHHYDMRQINGFADSARSEDGADYSIDQWTCRSQAGDAQKPRNYGQVMDQFQIQSLEGDQLDRSLNHQSRDMPTLLEGSAFGAAISDSSQWCPELEKEQPILRTNPIGFSQPPSRMNSVNASREASVDRDLSNIMAWHRPDSDDSDTKHSTELTNRLNASRQSNSDDTVLDAIEQLSHCLGNVSAENAAKIGHISECVQFELENQELRTPMLTKHIDLTDAMVSYLQNQMSTDPRHRAKVVKHLAELDALKQKQRQLMERMQAQSLVAKCWHFPQLSWVNGRPRSELDFAGEFYDHL